MKKFLLIVGTLAAAIFFVLTRTDAESPLNRLPSALADSTLVVVHEESRFLPSDNGCRWMIFRLSEKSTHALRANGIEAFRSEAADKWRPTPVITREQRTELAKQKASGDPCWEESLIWCRRKPSAHDGELLDGLRARAELPGSFVASEPDDCRLRLIVPDHDDGAAYFVLIEHA